MYDVIYVRSREGEVWARYADEVMLAGRPARCVR